MQDVLLAIHDRMLALRSLTLESLQVALATHLLRLEKTGTLFAPSQTLAVAGIPDEVRRLMRSAEKLAGIGVGFSPSMKLQLLSN